MLTAPRYTLAGRAMPQHDPRAYAFESTADDEPFIARSLSGVAGPADAQRAAGPTDRSPSHASKVPQS